MRTRLSHERGTRDALDLGLAILNHHGAVVLVDGLQGVPLKLVLPFAAAVGFMLVGEATTPVLVSDGGPNPAPAPAPQQNMHVGKAPAPVLLCDGGGNPAPAPAPQQNMHVGKAPAPVLLCDGGGNPAPPQDPKVRVIDAGVGLAGC
jgi:hypothetical protein